MTQDTAARDEARRSASEEQAGGKPELSESERNKVIAEKDKPEEIKGTGGLGKRTWRSNFFESHSNAMTGLSDIQSAPENIISGVSQSLWTGFFGFIGNSVRKGATAIGFTGEWWKNWVDKGSPATTPENSNSAEDVLVRETGKAYQGLSQILGFFGVDITTPSTADQTQAVRETPTVQPIADSRAGGQPVQPQAVDPRVAQTRGGR